MSKYKLFLRNGLSIFKRFVSDSGDSTKQAPRGDKVIKAADKAKAAKKGKVVEKLQKVENVVIDKESLMEGKETYIPRRCVLVVPGDNIERVQQAFQTNVDSLMLDLEDNVLPQRKADARQIIRTVLQEGKPVVARSFDLGVRVNPIDTLAFVKDVKEVLTSATLPDTLMLPKIRTPEQIAEFASYVKVYVTRHFRLNVILGIETVEAVMNLVAICKRAFDYGSFSNFRLAAIVFGKNDFLADLGAIASEDAREILYAQSKIVVCAKAFGMQPIDHATTHVKDNRGLLLLCKRSYNMGFSGKQAVHIDQVPVIQSAYVPTPEEIEWANAVIEAHRLYKEYGVGQFEFRGRMIDISKLRLAENILRMELIATDAEIATN